MPRLREKLRDLEKTLKADVALGRLALGGLLGDERLRVYRDGRIEGALMLRPEMLRAPKRTPGPTDSVVAGGCYDTVCDLPVALVLPVAGQVLLRAA
jgi:hypothetical protein